MTDTKETQALEYIKYIKELLRMARFHDSVREGVTLASPSKNSINSYLHKIEKALQSQAEKDRVMALMADALKGMMPNVTGYCQSMDWNEYNKRVKDAETAIQEHAKIVGKS